MSEKRSAGGRDKSNEEATYEVVTEIGSSHAQRPHGRDDEHSSGDKSDSSSNLELSVSENSQLWLLSECRLVSA